jgi:hypothetical protein
MRTLHKIAIFVAACLLLLFMSQALFPYDEYRAIYIARRVPVDSLDCFQTKGLELHPVIGDSWEMQVGRDHYLRESHTRGCKLHVDSGLNRFWTSTDTTVIRVEGEGRVKVVGPGAARVYFDNLAAGGQSENVRERLSIGPFLVFSDSMRYELVAGQTEISLGSLLEPAEFRIRDTWIDTLFRASIVPMQRECFEHVITDSVDVSYGWRFKGCETDPVYVNYFYGNGVTQVRALQVREN